MHGLNFFYKRLNFYNRKDKKQSKKRHFTTVKKTLKIGNDL